MLLNKAYYTLKVLVPRRLQIALRRFYVQRKRSQHAKDWPIDHHAGTPPEGWTGWPDGKKFALVLTHDVETAKGLNRCIPLAEIEESLGFRSSFSFVPGDYPVPETLRQDLTDRGFEIGVHGLHHNKNPFQSKQIFKKQSIDINRYLKEWGAVGFRSPSMHHDLELLHQLDIEYDSSTFDTDPFEPQPDGMGTIFPFWVSNQDPDKGYVELPYTLPQDFLLFILMQEKNIDTWKKKLEWIADYGGMVLLNVHPDYISTDQQPKYDQYPMKYYQEFLEYIKLNYRDEYWNALPREVSRYCKENCCTFRKAKRKLNVCMLAYSFYDTDARVRRYAETLVKRGDHVDVIALNSELNKKQGHEILNGVNVYRIQKRFLNETGKFDYLINLMKYLITSSYHLSKKHIRYPYDIVHVHSVPDFEVFAALLPKIFGSRIILDIHDPVPDLFAAKFGKDGNNKYIKLLALIERLSAAFADHVITVTDFWKERIAERSHLDDSKISVILNLPDINTFNIKGRTKSGKSNSDFTLLYPGTLNKHCGLDLVITAIGTLKEDIPSLKFQIYGQGSELHNLNKMVHDLQLNDVVYFNDYVPLEFVPQIMFEADIGIALLAGYNEYSQQALNVKLFEFLSMGLPAIATRTKSIEYYLDEGTVMLSAQNNPNDVANCIKELYFNVEKRDDLRRRGLDFISTKNSETEMKKYIEIINRLRI